MENNKYNSMFLILLYFFFIIMSMSMLLLGVQVFSGIAATVDDNYQIRTSLSYVATSVRQGNQKDNIFIEQYGPAKMLVIVDDNGITADEKRIYHYNSALYEINIRQGVAFKLDDGVKIVEIEDFAFDLQDGILNIAAKNTKGIYQTLSVTLRA